MTGTRGIAESSRHLPASLPRISHSLSVLRQSKMDYRDVLCNQKSRTETQRKELCKKQTCGLQTSREEGEEISFAGK